MDTLARYQRHRLGQGLTLIVLTAFLSMSAPAIEITLVTEGTQVGGPFDIEVYINGVTDFYGCGFDVVYDPARADVIDADDQTAGVQPKITEGALLSENGGTLTALLSALEDGTAGRLVVGISRKGAGLDGLDVSTPTLLMTIHMQGVSAGAATIGLENTITQDSVGAKMDVDPVTALELTVVDNARPTLDPIGPRSVDENAQLTFTVTGSDLDVGDTLTFDATGLPTGASFDAGTRVFTWTPGYDDAGTHDVEFSVTDDGQPQLADTETVTITVNNVNRAPVLGSIGPQTVVEGDTLNFTASGTDDDGDNLTFSAGTLPGTSSFDAGTRTFTWATQVGDAGSYQVAISVTDDGTPNLDDSETVVNITVTENTPPVISDPGAQSVDEGSNLSFTISATDADGDTVVLSAGTLPSGATFTAGTGAFSWTPEDGTAGTYDVTFTATDSLQATDSVTVTITVNDACLKPAAPANVSASDATFADKVRVTWRAVDGVSIEYRVYRSATDSFGSATALGTWTTALSFDDRTAAAPVVTETPGGCTAPPETDVEFKYFFYWVVARAGDGCESDPSASDRGHRGQSAKSNETDTLFAPALPGRNFGGNVRLAYPGEDLAVRLRGAELAPDSIWAEADAPAGNTATMWQPAEEGMDDVWVVLPADAAWQPGDQITLTAGALTTDGEEVEAVSFTFEIAEAPEETVPLSQPVYESLDLGELTVEEGAGEAAVYGVETSAGAAFAIEGGVFEVPQRVWLPLPDGIAPSEAAVYYYHEAGEDTGWYPGEDIAGWLVEDSYRYVELDGVPYVGFTVRHGATVQLGVADTVDQAASASTMNPGILANLLLIAVVVLGLLVPKKQRQ